MHDLVDALVNRRRAVEPDMCRSFWARLQNEQVDRAEAAALLAALSTRMPDPDTVVTFLASLHERRQVPGVGFPRAANIVGTGGGPGTFNISTAAAFVAAAMGVRVVKTGSRANSGKVGSINLLDRLHISPARSYDEVGERLDEFGIAFVGYFVYPVELTRLARTVLPLDMRTIGRFVNTVGPFLAAIQVSAQVTGVSDRANLPTMRRLADSRQGTRVWLCSNELGADELLSCAVNQIYDTDTGEFVVRPQELGVGGGDLSDLRGAPQDDQLIPHFQALLAGRAPHPAVATVCLNAAALAVAVGTVPDLATGVRDARAVVHDGAAAELLTRMRERAPAEVSARG